MYTSQLERSVQRHAQKEARQALLLSAFSMSWGRCEFRCESKTHLFGLPKTDGIRNQWLKFMYNAVPEQYSPKVRLCAAHFTKDCFLNLGEYNAGYTQRLLLKHGAVPTLLGQPFVSATKKRNHRASRFRPASSRTEVMGGVCIQKSTKVDLQYSLMVSKKNTENGVEDNSGSSDEDTDVCDQDSVASSVDSTAEEMFMDGLDCVLDRGPSTDIYPTEEDGYSEACLQQRKRIRLSSTSSADGGRESENYDFSGISTERWHSSEEADVELLQLDFSPVQEPGPKFLPNRCNSPLQFFQLFFSKTSLQTIVGHTNDYGAKCQERKGKTWENMCQNDLKLYIALVIYMGMVKCSSLTDYWSVSQHFSLPFPAKVMSYQKFLSISKALHLSDSREDAKNSVKRGTAAYERLGKIQPLYQVIREACKTFFHPFQNITIVERMVASQDRTGLKRCMKNESPNMGYKLFALTDCTCGYTWDFFIYEGKSCTSQSEGLSYESVMALVDENMLGSGYKLFVDKFYTSPTLFRDLLWKKIWACGPVWRNRIGFPKTTVNRLPRNAPRGTMRWIREGKLLFVEWKDSQEVQMCSTFHKAYEGDAVQRKVKGDGQRTLVEVPIPVAVLDYKKNMEAVDPSNSVTGHYRALHKPKKWYQCVFYHFLDITVENAFIMHKLMAKRKDTKPLTRKAFLEALILELTEMSP